MYQNKNFKRMKTKILTYSVLSFFILAFASCNPKKAIEDKINETIAEKVAGTMLGTDVESSNLSNAEKATAKIDVKMDGNPIGFENVKPILNIAGGGDDKAVVAINFVQETEGQQQTIQIGFSGKKDLFKVPMTANFGDSQDDKVAPMFNIMMISDAGMKIQTITKGTLKVVEFSEDKVVLEIDAEGGENNLDTHEGKNLVPVKGTIVCESPMTTYIGIKKEEIFN